MELATFARGGPWTTVRTRWPSLRGEPVRGVGDLESASAAGCPRLWSTAGPVTSIPTPSRSVIPGAAVVTRPCSSASVISVVRCWWRRALATPGRFHDPLAGLGDRGAGGGQCGRGCGIGIDRDPACLARGGPAGPGGSPPPPTRPPDADAGPGPRHRSWCPPPRPGPAHRTPAATQPGPPARRGRRKLAVTHLPA